MQLEINRKSDCDKFEESVAIVTVSNMMLLKSILENYKRHVFKEMEKIISDSQNVFEINNLSDALLKIENGLNIIDNSLHPEDCRKAVEDDELKDHITSSDSDEKIEENKNDVNGLINLLSEILKQYDNSKKPDFVDALFMNPKWIKMYRNFMAMNTYVDTEDKDDNKEV